MRIQLFHIFYKFYENHDLLASGIILNIHSTLTWYSLYITVTMLNMILVIKCFHLSPVMTRSNWPHYFVVFDFHIKFWSTERTDQREMKDPMCSPQNSISHNCGEKNISSRYRSKNR